jgi:hypothetical protein
MSDLVKTVMEAAASELLHQEAIQVDLEMEQLLAEMALDPLVEGRRHELALHFLALLKRRSEIACRALSIANGHGAKRAA